MAKVIDYKKEIKIIEKPVTQESDEDNWVALKDTKIELKPKKLYYPDQDNGKKYVYSMQPVDDNTELILIDNDDNKIECKPDGVETSDDGTVDTLDILDDDSCIATYTFDKEDAKDLSGNYDGTETNVTYSDGKFGKCFDGVNESDDKYIDLPDDLGKSDDKTLTLSCWCKFANQKDDGGLVIKLDQHSTTHIGYSTDNNCRLNGVRQSDDTYKYYDITLEQDKWYHLVISISKDEIKYYVNNELKETQDYDGTWNEDGYGNRIGQNNKQDEDYTQSYAGLIDQIRVFNKALSDDEVDTLYNESVTKYKIDISSQDLDEEPKLVTYKPNITKINLILNQDSEISNIEFDILNKNKIYTRNITVDSDDNDKFYVNVANKQDIVILEDKAITKSNVEEVTDGTSDTLDILGDDSCIAAYTFDGNADDLSDNYNGQWKDSDGNDIDGVYEDGKFGKCMYSEDEGKYIQFGTNLAKDVFDGKNVITFSFWIKFKDYDNVNGRIIRINNEDGDDNGIYIMKNRIGSGGGDSDITGSEIPNKLDNHIWYHIVGISDGDNGSKIYVNNKLKGQDSTEFYNIKSDNEFVIGYDENYTHTPLWIDQVRIFNKALNEDEINVLYNEGVAKFKLSKDNIKISNIPEKTLVVNNIKLNELVKTFDKDKTEVYLPDAIPDNSVVLFDEEKVTVTETKQLEDTIIDTKDPLGDGSEKAFWKLNGNADDEHGDYNGQWKDKDDKDIDGTYDNGKFGKGAKFDGESYIDTGYKTQDLIDNNSFSLWFKANPDDNANDVEFFGYRDANNKGSLALYWDNKYNRLELASSGGSDYISVRFSNVNTIINTWIHICGVYKDGTQTLYVNGVKIGTSDLGSDGDDNYNIYLGYTKTDRSNKLVGLLDQIRIFNKTLTAEEVQRLYYEDKKLIELKYDKLDNTPAKLEIPRPVKASKPIDLTWDKDNSIFNMSLTDVSEINTRNLQRTLVLPEKLEEISKITSEVYVGDE